MSYKANDAKDKKIHDLFLSLDALEQYGRRHSLRFFGIKEHENENTDSILLDIFRDKLGVNLQLEDIQRSHRVGRKGADNRAIIVRFCSYRTRAKVWRAKTKLKNSDIFVSEDLTRYRNKLAYSARKLKREKRLVDTYTTDGKILVKARLNLNDPTPKTFEVKEEADLDKYRHAD